MKYLTTALLGTLAVVSCSDGGTGPKSSAGSGGSASGMGGTPSTGSGGTTSGTGGTASGTGGSSAPGAGGSGNGLGGGGSSAAGGENTGGNVGGGGDSNPGTGGRPVTPEGGAGATGTGGSMAMPEAGDGLRHGPFKMLVMSTVLEYAHASIPTCLTMLRALAQTSDADLARIGAPAGSQWTVDVMGTNPAAAGYFSEITAANLANYELFYSDNPTGPVFTNAPDGANKKAIFQAWFNGGGSWAGQHSATDFENNNRWTWFQDNVAGGWFVTHDANTLEPGTVVWEAAYANHPILRGLASPWNTGEEWYVMNRNIEAVPGFQILAKVTVSNSSLANGRTPRPAIWIKENPAGGRSFYTIQGHEPSVYAGQEFRDLMLRGILWAVHRLK
jgi:type 1 glutamine amidotransferase